MYCPRLTGSPGIQQASEWAHEDVEWGLVNGTQERWSLGKAGRSCASGRTWVEPQIQPLIGLPLERSSGTKGPVTADVVRVQIRIEAHFSRSIEASSRGGSCSRSRPRMVRMLGGPINLRATTDKDVAEAETTPVPAAAGGGR